MREPISEVAIARVDEPSLHVPERVLIGGELDVLSGAVGFQGTDVVGGVGVGLCPDLLVAAVGEGVLHVELEVVDLPRREPVDEGKERVQRRHLVPRHVNHDAAPLHVRPVDDGADGKPPAEPAARGQVRELVKGAPPVKGPGFVPCAYSHRRGRKLDPISLRREGP